MLSDQCSLLNIWYIFPSFNLFFIFMTVPDKHLCPYCESIHWWGIDAQVSQDVVWENSWNFLIMGSTCFSSYQTDRNLLYKYFVITISLNVSTNGWYYCFTRQKMYYLCNREALVFLKNGPVIFTNTSSTF